MNILVVGGTRFFGVHLVESLLKHGHEVTILTRGNTRDTFGNKVKRLLLDRTDLDSLIYNLSEKKYDVVYDNIAYSSNDVKKLLDTVKCDRYIVTSSASIYSNWHMDMKEEEFNPLTHPLKWCDRTDDTYDELKRQVECATFTEYKNIPSVAVRFPFVIGEDDYTKRLYFYVEHVVKEIPMNVDNIESSICYVDSKEAGSFLAWLVGQPHTGPINGCNYGNKKISEIIDYVKGKTGKIPIFHKDGDEGPYNGSESFSLSVDKCNQWGYEFTDLNDWFNNLIDSYIEIASTS